MAYRRERYYLRLGILSVFQRIITKTRTTHSNFSINNFSVWRIGGAITGTLCSIAFMKYGPQRPEPFADEEDIDEKEEEASSEEETKQSY